MKQSPMKYQGNAAWHRPVRLLEDRVSRVLFSFDQRAAMQLVKHGGSGRPLLLLRDAAATKFFRMRSSWRAERLAALEAASTLAECLAAVEQVLPLNQIQSEISGFLTWARGHAPKRFCEIGVENGGTHLVLKHALGSPELAIGVDLYVRNKEQLTYFSQRSQRDVLIDGSSYDPATVAKVQAALGDELLDLLFIDGDHSFDGAAQDFERYRHLVRRGGIIAFHDIVEDSITRTGYHSGSYVGELPALWRQLRDQYAEHREFVDSWEQDGYGIGAIIYDPDVTPRLEPPGKQ